MDEVVSPLGDQFKVKGLRIFSAIIMSNALGPPLSVSFIAIILFPLFNKPGEK